MKNRSSKKIINIISIVFVSFFLFSAITGCHRKSDTSKSDATTQIDNEITSPQKPSNEEDQIKAVVDYVGQYLDEDNNEPNLYIVSLPDGNYSVEIGIFRLTYIDDGIGTVTPDGLSFTATDANGEPIGGIITLQGDTATVTFTNSTWTYIENGQSFRYFKQR